MNRPVQTNQGMKPGTSTTSLANEMKQQVGISRDVLNKFLEDVAYAMAEGATEEEVPHIEAPREVIQHFNKAKMDAFDQTRFFMFNGVKVYEEGKKDWAREQENMSVYQKEKLRQR